MSGGPEPVAPNGSGAKPGNSGPTTDSSKPSTPVSTDARRKPPLRCQVEGCNEELSNAKRYHQRHKICDYHLKGKSVLINGTQQRFCQKCSRFQELHEFDGDRRSCRERLTMHNSRRRKNPGQEQDPSSMGVSTLSEPAQRESSTTNDSMEISSFAAARAGPIDLERMACTRLGGDHAGVWGGVSITGDEGIDSLFDNLHADGASDHVNMPTMPRQGSDRRRPRRSNTMPCMWEHGAPLPHVFGGTHGAAVTEMLSTRGSASIFIPEVHVVHISLELLGHSHALLPINIKEEIGRILPGVATMAGYDHDGSAFLSLDVVQEVSNKPRTQQLGLRGLLTELAKGPAESFWKRSTYKIWMGPELAQVLAGRVEVCNSNTQMGGFTGCIQSVAPLVLPPSGDQNIHIMVNSNSARQFQPQLVTGSARLENQVIPLTLDSVETMPEGTLMQFRLWNSAVSGIVHLELSERSWRSDVKTVLVSDNPALQREMYDAAQTMINVDLLLEEIGILLAYSASLEGSVGPGMTWSLRQFQPLLRRVACSVLAFSCSRGWPWIASIAMNVLTSGSASASAVVAEVESQIGSGLTLLHLAVCSRHPPILRWLLSWADSNNYTWDLGWMSLTGVSVEALSIAVMDPRVSEELEKHKWKRSTGQNTAVDFDIETDMELALQWTSINDFGNGSMGSGNHGQRLPRRAASLSSSGVRGVQKTSSRRNLIGRQRSNGRLLGNIDEPLADLLASKSSGDVLNMYSGPTSFDMGSSFGTPPQMDGGFDFDGGRAAPAGGGFGAANSMADALPGGLPSSSGFGDFQAMPAIMQVQGPGNFQPQPSHMGAGQWSPKADTSPQGSQNLSNQMSAGNTSPGVTYQSQP